MWSSGPAGGGLAKIRRGPAAGPVGDGVGWSRGCYGPVGEVGPGKRAAGNGRQRRSRAAASGATAPARPRPMRGNRWWWRLLWMLEEGLGQLVGRGS
jgi:hypothetical protein